jgi:polyphenol oxidase
MPITSLGGLRYYQFTIFPRKRVRQGIFTRHGGASPAPWSSLNLGGTVGDDRSVVIENHRRMFKSAELPFDSMFDVWQVHGRDVVFADAPRQLEAEHQKADVTLTNKVGITLLMRFADCVPIFLFDPIKNVIGIVHAGWQGTVKKAAAAAVEAMTEHYHSNPRDVLAGIGPSIGVDHYEVGSDVVSAAKQAFGDRANDLLMMNNDQVHFDLWKANQFVLQESGVNSIEVAGVCTACSNSDWFSHRAEKGRTGRFGALLALTPAGD